ncbi:MAG TPA: ABC transporter ATP-binding protein [Verrucomicrobiae bacterium]|nr:ABC transporter ATP-binding protein [Verrucomicrobiae bacterium]
MTLVARDLRKRFAEHVALDGVSFAVSSGQTLAIVGPSGAGKSTLLRVIAGLERPDAGTVSLHDRDLDGMQPQQRRIAMVFQDDALVPRMSVAENLRFAMRGAPAQSRVVELARALHLHEHLATPARQLSGGQRQRVAIGRALLSDPLALLLDEPVAHLDPALRAHVRDEVVRLRERFDGPMLYVTHDHVEAMALADRLVILIDGRIEQAGAPQSVYDAPRNLRVARFLGTPPMNLVDGVSEALGMGNVVIGIRPEYVLVGDGGPLRGRILRRERAGADTFLFVETPHGTTIARIDSTAPGDPGSTVALTFPRERVVRFDRLTGEAIA